MEIYNIYEAIINILLATKGGDVSVLASNGRPFVLALLVSCAVLAIVFVFYAIGLFVMSKKRNLTKKWLCFIPFVNLLQVGRLAGECSVFGRKMKHAGLYAMIAQIVCFLFVGVSIFSEFYLFVHHGETMLVQEGSVYWESLSRSGEIAFNFYRVSEYVVSVAGLIQMVLLFVLFSGLYKKYYTRGYTLLSWLTILVPLSRFIIVFVLRKNKAIDFDAYMRRKREEYARRMSAYGPYGNPYGQNLYGNPYNNPYRPSSSEEKKAEEPFEEFSSGDDPFDFEEPTGTDEDSDDDLFN